MFVAALYHVSISSETPDETTDLAGLSYLHQISVHSFSVLAASTVC